MMNHVTAKSVQFLKAIPTSEPRCNFWWTQIQYDVTLHTRFKRRIKLRCTLIQKKLFTLHWCYVTERNSLWSVWWLWLF